jgi:hypothetical protein
MPISTIGQNGLNAPLSLTSSTLTGTTTATTITAPTSTALTLQSNNGTTGVTLSTSGYVNMPLQPAFVVAGTAGTTVANMGIIIFINTALNRGTCYSTSTGIFTTPVTGLYSFNCSVLWQSLGAGQAVEGYIGINGNGGAGANFGRLNYQSTYTGYGGYMATQGSVNFYLTAGDTVAIYNISGAGLSVYGGTGWSFFSGYLVG